MGNRISISFINGSEESVSFFSHWDGLELYDSAKEYIAKLRGHINKEIPNNGPLGRMEPCTVMVDFIRYYIRKQKLKCVESNYYLGKDDCDGDNSDNGHFYVDVSGKETKETSIFGGV